MIDIKRFRDEQKITQKELCEILSLTQPFISQVERGNKKLSDDSERLLYNHYGNIVDEYKVSQVSEKPTEYKSRLAFKMIPETSFEFSAGGSLILTDDKVVNYWYLPDCTDCEAIVPMRGESMMPKYPPGSKLALKKFGVANPLAIPFGQEFAIVLEDTTTGFYHGHIKILRRHPDREMSKKYWIARSINKEYDDFEIEIDQVRSLWIVKQYAVNNVLL